MNKSFPHLFFWLSLFSMLIVHPLILRAQDYTVGVAVCDTIYNEVREWADSHDDYEKFRLDSSLYDYVTGLQFQVEITDIKGFVYSNVSDTVYSGDVFQLPTLTQTGLLQIFFTEFGDYFDYVIKIVGIPQIAGESYYSDIAVYSTLALTRNTVTIFPWSDSTRIVQLPTAVNDNLPELPSVFTLEQNYPNPFNPSTTILFSVVKRISVTVKVFDILGREITTLVNDEVLPPGMHKRIFDADHLPNGIYLYRMRAGEFEQTKKLTLLK